MINFELVYELMHNLSPGDDDDITPGASEDDIASFEQQYGIAIPEDLRAWLKFTNQPLTPPYYYGIRTTRKDAPPARSLTIESLYEIYPLWKTMGWIPIAGDGCGNDYVMLAAGECGDGRPIAYVDAMEDTNKPAEIMASTLGKFLEYLLADELRRTYRRQSEVPPACLAQVPEDIFEHDPALRNLRATTSTD